MAIRSPGQKVTWELAVSVLKDDRDPIISQELRQHAASPVTGHLKSGRQNMIRGRQRRSTGR